MIYSVFLGGYEIRTRKFETPKLSHCYETFPHISKKVDKSLLTATFSLERMNPIENT